MCLIDEPSLKEIEPWEGYFKNPFKSIAKKKNMKNWGVLVCISHAPLIPFFNFDL